MTWQEVWLAGLGGSLMGGILSAITAVVVVRLTARGERRRALEREGRETVVDLTEATIDYMHLHAVYEGPESTQADERAALVARNRWLNLLFHTCAVMDTVEPPLAKRLAQLTLDQDEEHMQANDLALCLMYCWDWPGFKMDALRE